MIAVCELTTGNGLCFRAEPPAYAGMKACKRVLFCPKVSDIRLDRSEKTDSENRPIIAIIIQRGEGAALNGQLARVPRVNNCRPVVIEMVVCFPAVFR